MFCLTYTDQQLFIGRQPGDPTVFLGLTPWASACCHSSVYFSPCGFRDCTSSSIGPCPRGFACASPPGVCPVPMILWALRIAVHTFGNRCRVSVTCIPRFGTCGLNQLVWHPVPALELMRDRVVASLGSGPCPFPRLVLVLILFTSCRSACSHL